jgi:hypothetical protein
MSTEIVKQSFDLALPTEAMKVAEILQRFVKEKKLTANIKGKEYPLVEAWCFAGSQLGLYPLLMEVKNLSLDALNAMGSEIKYQATVEIRKLGDNTVLSRGIAVCSNKEASKRAFDEYAICSMAQTRAEGKAFRMLLSWIMKAAGFEATPAEEMDFTEVKEEKAKATTLHNHKKIEENGLPLITNKQLKQACERIVKGEIDIYYKVMADFSMTKEQENALIDSYNKVKQPA